MKCYFFRYFHFFFLVASEHRKLVHFIFFLNGKRDAVHDKKKIDENLSKWCVLFILLNILRFYFAMMCKQNVQIVEIVCSNVSAENINYIVANSNQELKTFKYKITTTKKVILSCSTTFTEIPNFVQFIFLVCRIDSVSHIHKIVSNIVSS